MNNIAPLPPSVELTALLAMEERLRISASVFANSREGIMIADAGGFIADVNPAFEYITGYTRNEVIGRTPKILSSGHHTPDFYTALWSAVHETGSWTGPVINRKKTGEVFAELLSIREIRDPTGQVSHYIGTFTDLSDLYDDHAQIDALIHRDALTGLANRRLFNDRAGRLISRCAGGRRAAICLVDVDGFAAINRRFSFKAGDAMLVDMARRLKGCLTGDEVVARFEGDCFVLLFGFGRLDECDSRLQEISAVLARPFSRDGESLTLAVSIGVAVSGTAPGDEKRGVETLIDEARQALQQGAQEPDHPYRFFDAAHDLQVREQHQLRSELGVAIEAGQLVLHYQPKVDMTSGRVMGAEALIRWQHPVRGLLHPEQFLHVATASGLEIALGEWVLNSAIDQMVNWRDAGLRLRLSVNLSPSQFADAGFARRLRDALSRHPGAWAEDLEIDLSETALPPDTLHLEEAFATCRALGVRLALDNFGNGNAPLRFMMQGVTDVLKLDPALSRHVASDAAVVSQLEGIIKIAHAFEREIVAAGVESIEQGAWLIHLGCRFAQGSIIALPMPAGQFAAWAAAWHGHPIWTGVAGLPIANEDMPLVVAEVWLHQWIDAFVRDISGTDSDSASVAESNFARWLQDSGHARHGHLEVYRRVEAYYHTLHAMTQEIQRQALSDRTRAISRLGNVCDLRDRLIETIAELMGELLINNG